MEKAQEIPAASPAPASAPKTSYFAKERGTSRTTVLGAGAEELRYLKDPQEFFSKMSVEDKAKLMEGFFDGMSNAEKAAMLRSISGIDNAAILEGMSDAEKAAMI